MESTEAPAHLSVILDLSPTQWHLSASPKNPNPLPFRSFLSQVLVFINSHLALQHENTVAVFGAFPGQSVMLYSSSEPEPEGIVADANTYQPFKAMNSTIIKRITEEMEALKDAEEEVPCQLVGALAKALCCINRISHANPSKDDAASANAASRGEPRIVILSVSPDLSASYIPLMNAIFSAQKLKVTIDVSKVYGPDAVFLQQAAHLTGGSYIYLDRNKEALLQHLVMTFLPLPSMRRLMLVPTQDKIDFRAACFCHKKIVDIGFVCSVCLSIFCRPTPVCSTCKTKFPIKSLQRLNASKPAVTSAASPMPPSRAASVSRASPGGLSMTAPTPLRNSTVAPSTNGAMNGAVNNR